MARAVYSTRFIGFESAVNATDSYTVPSGFVAVIRDITAFLASSAVTLAQVFIEEPNCVLLDATGSGLTPTIAQWTGRTVCNEGEHIEAVIDAAAACSIAVSGYLLSL